MYGHFARHLIFGALLAALAYAGGCNGPGHFHGTFKSPTIEVDIGGDQESTAVKEVPTSQP